MRRRIPFDDAEAAKGIKPVICSANPENANIFRRGVEGAAPYIWRGAAIKQNGKFIFIALSSDKRKTINSKRKTAQVGTPYDRSDIFENGCHFDRRAKPGVEKSVPLQRKYGFLDSAALRSK